MRPSTLTRSAVALIAGLVVACGEAAPTTPEEPPAAAEAAAPGALGISQASKATGRPTDTGVTRTSGTSIICGLLVEFTVFDAGASWAADFGPPRRDTGRNVITLTNPENGKSVRIPIAGQVTREIVAFHDDGSFTVRQENDGLVSHIQPLQGPPLTLGAGRLILQFRVIPQPGGGFILADLEVLFDAGPHPDGLQLGGPAFCEAVVEALT